MLRFIRGGVEAKLPPAIKRHFMVGLHGTFHGYFGTFLKVVNFAAPFPSPFNASMKPS